jgi:hypothetical protein
MPDATISAGLSKAMLKTLHVRSIEDTPDLILMINVLLRSQL